MSTTEFNELDEWLGHSGSDKRGQFLKSWTKNGSIRIWLHTRRLPVAVWRHPFPQMIVYDDKQTGDQIINFWSRDHTCWEDEGFLKVQYRRDKDTQELNVEPRRCSLCRLTDCIHMMIVRGQLDWAAPVFRFDGATDGKPVILHAGGMCGMYGSDRLTEEQIKYLNKMGIRRDEAWRENSHAKLQYILCVVDNDDVRAGVQIAPQAGTVGEKVKDAIRDTRASLGDEAGNPTMHPFCIELTYDPRVPALKRYHARRVERYRLTPAIEELIRGEPPSLTGITRQFDQASMRPFLERYALIDLPWDEIFRVPQLTPADPDADFPHGANAPNGRTEEEPQRARGGRRVQQQQPPPPPKSSARDVAMISCDECGKPMPEDARQCRACGTTYEFDDDESESAEDTPPAPPPGRVTGSKLPFDRR